MTKRVRKTDVPAAKKFELAEQNYHYLFDNASDAMWVHDMDGNILVANKACEKLTGYKMDELASMKVTTLLPVAFLDSARDVKRRLLNGETIEEPYEQRLVRKDLSIGIVKMATSLVVILGQPAGFQNIARDVTEEKRMQENLSYYVEQITMAQENERKRLSRQLHDEVAPPLLLLIQRLDSVASLTRPRISPSLRGEMEQLRSQAIDALEGVRRCAQDLRPSILDDLGLVAALEWIADDLVKKYNIDAHVETSGSERSLPGEVQLLLFRIAQEALSNIRRHAHARSATLRLEFGANRAKLTVEDNGTGFDMGGQTTDFARNGKLGIAGMYERARLLGGTLSINTAPGKGTRVIADVPVPG